MVKLDVTLDDVQNTRFGNKYHDLTKQMVKQTQFTEVEITSILMVYHKFVLANGLKAKTMTKKQFYKLFEAIFCIYDLEIIERILAILTTTDSLKELEAVAWVKMFAVFLSKKLEPRMRFVFQVYDTHDLGVINREIVTHAVEKFFTGEDEDEINELRADMVEVIFKKFDVDRDGAISYEDYSSVVMKDPLNLEFLGTCIPSLNGVTLTSYCLNIMSLILVAESNI